MTLLAPTTFAPPVSDTRPVVVTGNTWVALPDIGLDGVIASLNVTHAGVSGLLALTGEPLFAPAVVLHGQTYPLTGVQWSRLGDWVPQFSGQAAGVQAEFTVLTPPGEQGLVLHLTVSGHPDARAALISRPQAVRLQRFRDDDLSVSLSSSYDAWTQAHVTEARAGTPLLAIGVRGLEGLERQGETLVAPGPTLTACVGVARDADGARTTAVHLARLVAGFGGRAGGFTALLTGVLDELARLAAPFPVLARPHALYNHFYSAGDEIDGTGQALMTSRSPRYYVAGAYWSRDALLWSFPATLLADPAEAEQRLLTALERYTAAPGEHAQYLDGRPLYPGFELDEAAAYPWAVARYVQHTGRTHLLDDPVVRRGLARVDARIDRAAHPSGLYTTQLGPTDDPVPYPLLPYSNALLAAGWRDLARLTPAGPRRSELDARAKALTRALWRHGVAEGPHGPQFVWATDAGESGAAGQHTLHDEPAGSLTLLAYLGHCAADDPVYRNTLRWVTTASNPHHYSGPFPGQGSPHFPHPSGFGLANSLLVGGEAAQTAQMVLSRAPLDGGLACEGYDVQTGVVRTGAGFAACSGFLAWTLAHAAGAGER